MTDTYRFIRYLDAKKAIDDRSLNQHVWQRLAEHAGRMQEAGEILVLEAGCGTGTMVERMVDGGLLTKACYTAVDREPECISVAESRLATYGRKKGWGVEKTAGGPLSLRGETRRVDVELVPADVFEFLAARAGRAFDLIVAHAFLDLVDLDSTIRLFVSNLSPGGLLYLTLNFDGATIFEPPLGIVDKEIERLYHADMDRKGRSGSRTGRRLLACLSRLKVPILAAGSSDWVVCPGPRGYTADESYFLHFIVDTVGEALTGKEVSNGMTVEEWTGLRHRMVEQAQLIYIAHQLDVLARKAV